MGQRSGSQGTSAVGRVWTDWPLSLPPPPFFPPTNIYRSVMMTASSPQQISRGLSWWQPALEVFYPVHFSPTETEKFSVNVNVLPCYKWIWSYLPPWTLTYLRFALLRIPACSKSNNTNARLTAFALSLTLDPKFGIRSHKTSGNAKLLHLLRRTWKLSFFHSTSLPFNFSSLFSYQKLYLCVCVCVLMLVCACINASVCVLVCAIHLLIH